MKKYDHLSMGCQVPYNNCELCKKCIDIETCSCTKKKNIFYIEDKDFKFISFSIVKDPPDPRCRIIQIKDGYEK